MAIGDLVCYFDSLHCINLIIIPPTKFHTYAVLIQDIKEPIDQNNVTICLEKGTNVRTFWPSLELPQILIFPSTLHLPKAFEVF